MSAQQEVPFLDLKGQHALLRGELDAAVAAVIDRADFIKGASVGAFEEEFGAYQQAGHCIAVGNGTDALEIALAALELPPGSEVIVPANTFIATSEAVTRCGLTVVFADVDATFTLDLTDVRARLTDRTSAVIAVHLYGQPADIAGLAAMCAPLGIRIVEDAAQAHGAQIADRRVGAIADIGTFSFFPGKNLGAFGDAGAIVTNDSELATRARRIADHGRIAKYDHDREGRNSRMDTMQAAVLRVKLGHLDTWIDVRTTAAQQYRAALAARGTACAAVHDGPASTWARPLGTGQTALPAVRPAVRHAYHLYVLRAHDRNGLREALSAAGVATGVHYPTILPRLKAYSGHPQHAEPFACDAWAGELLSLPMGDHMNPELVGVVLDALKAHQGTTA